MGTAERATRKSLPLTPSDVDHLAMLRASAEHREALSDLAGSVVSERSSEAALLHAVWEVGMKAVQERVEEEGYAQLAEERDTSRRKSVARRRRPTWADDE